ncbi:MAG: hypothetical protein C0501_09495 [Isosphaera sp.]|nr:hypothetical protein [Isosphaera sp.]
MSGLAATNSQPTPPRTARLAPGAVLVALAALAAAAGPPARGQETDPASKGAKAVDARPPLPPTDPKRVELAEKLRVPQPDRAIFQGRTDAKGNQVPGTGIQDFTPFVSEARNPDEYEAWQEVVAHARQFDAAVLEEHASRDLLRDELLAAPRYGVRLGLLRFDGRLTKVRRVAAPAGPDGQARDLFEALLVPVPEPPGAVVSAVFSDWPAGLGEKPGADWRDADGWATAAGYFFKVKQDDAPGAPAIPVLVCRAVTPRAAAPVAAGPNPAALDKGLRVFRFVRDDKEVAGAETNPEEAWAWNHVLLHARRFDPEELERHAAPVDFARLFNEGRDFRNELVGFEGRLLMLRETKPTGKLLAAGAEKLYEGWVVPKDTPGGNPVCVVFTDPPAGAEATGRVNLWVSVAGYSFKLFRYQSGEREKDDPAKFKAKRAPLVLARTVLVRPDPEAPSKWTWGGGFVPAVAGLLFGTLMFAVVLIWWFRRGDRQARREIDAHRGRNPFADPGPA